MPVLEQDIHTNENKRDRPVVPDNLIELRPAETVEQKHNADSDKNNSHPVALHGFTNT